MNVVIINKSDFNGGAAVVSYRLMNALRRRGVNASMLVADKITDSPHVRLAASRLRINAEFIADRLPVFFANRFNYGNVFKADSASAGLPLHRHPLVLGADVICLNWINQGVLSLRGIGQLLRLGKPIVWTMHDMWCFTGICHHAGACRRWTAHCGDCPLLGKGASARDLSYRTLQKKLSVYDLSSRLHFVAVSNWLADRTRNSTLLRNIPVTVIPNAFPIEELHTPIRGKNADNDPSVPFRIVFGAARLDDSIKGLPILVEATGILKTNYPEESSKIELVTFGSLKNPRALDDIAISHKHLGIISGEESIREIYRNADAVISTSLYETLPGTLVEGQVYGCIPVAFDRGGQSDIIDHLHTGYLAEWNDDKERAARNIADGILWAMKQDREKICGRMLESARNRFDAPVVAGKYLDLFESLL